jgi:predicted nucleotidyltransferase
MTPDLSTITEKIVSEFHPERIVLFGSQASGTARAESDIDLFIEMHTTLRGPHRGARVASIFGLRDWPLDIVVYTPEEVRRLRSVRGTFLECIEREGRVLYERA